MNDDKEIPNQDDRNDDIEYRMIENQVKEMKIKSTNLYILLILSCFLSAKAQKFDNIDTKGNSIHSIFRLYFQQKILPLQYWNLQTILVFKKKNPKMSYRHSGNCYRYRKFEKRNEKSPSPFATLHHPSSQSKRRI